MQTKTLVTAFAAAALFGAGFLTGIHFENEGSSGSIATQTETLPATIVSEAGNPDRPEPREIDVALFQAIEDGNMARVMDLVDNQGADPDAALDEYWGAHSGFSGHETAVSWAIFKGDVKSAEFLLKRGAARDPIYMSEALLNADTAMARMLIDNGVEYDRMGPEELRTIINNCYRDQSRPFAESDKDFGFIDFVVGKYGIPVTDEIIAAEGGHISRALFAHLQELQRTQKAAPKALVPGI